ncbi:unnamed protein product [Ixodes pacificus]
METNRASPKVLTFDADGVQVEELAASLGPVGLLGEQDGVVRRVHPRCRCAVTAGDHHGDNGAPFRPKRHTHTHALTRAGTTQRQHDASTRKCGHFELSAQRTISAPASARSSAGQLQPQRGR